MRHYIMVFNTKIGSRRSIRINNPNTDLPALKIADAVEQLLANDIFDSSRGGLESLNRMELTVIERTQIL